MSYREFKPSTPHPAIDAIWYADSADKGVDYTVSPELGANLVIKLFPDGSEVVLSGAVTRQQTYPYIPKAHYFGIRFQAGYHFAHQLASLYELQNTSMNLPKNILHTWDCLDERLYAAPTLETQLALVQEQTTCLAANTLDLPATVQEALDHIDGQRGVISVRELTQLTMVSERQLERLFKAHLGLSPKVVCNTVRIRQILRILWQSSEKPMLTDIAHRFGYVDQSHLANDFRTIMGMSISEYMQE